MSRKLFRFKWVASQKERTLGVVFRLFGLDFAFILMGYVNDWRLIDLRVPNNYGMYLQILFAFVSIAVCDDDIYLVQL